MVSGDRELLDRIQNEKLLTEDELNVLFKNLMNTYEKDDEDQDKNIIKFYLDNIHLNEENRVVVPALWDKKVLHLLPNNFWICKNLLTSVFKKLKNDFEKLSQYDSVIAQQLRDGIISKSDRTLDELRNDSNVSFIAHNGVFRPKAETTQCRVVLLSNLCEKGNGNTMSHNQVSLPGPQFNNKIFTTCTLLRFNKYLLLYDLEKAFLQLCLTEQDSQKLHFLWFKDILNEDFDIVPYKFERLPFGLRFSPFLLMMTIYYILIINNADIDQNISNMLFNLCYMDNLAYSASNTSQMLEAYEASCTLFNKYKFNLQKFATNNPELRDKFPSTEKDSLIHNLLGISWNVEKDVLFNGKAYLNPDASTKRQILSTINSNFDLFGIFIPILNRAKLFLNKIQSEFGWDDPFGKELTSEWRNIASQVNSGPELTVPRYIGDYDSEYKILVFTDASKNFLSTVLFLYELGTGKVSFVLAKNRLVAGNLARKTIPVLELMAMKFGVKISIDFKNQLSNAFCPVNISSVELHSDSMISLQWLRAKCYKTSKVEKKGNNVNSVLNSIVDSIANENFSFFHISGDKNPADMGTKTVSAKVLSSTNFFDGPDKKDLSEVPMISSQKGVFAACNLINGEHTKKTSPMDINKYSSFQKVCKIYHFVRKYIYLLKIKVSRKNPLRFEGVKYPKYVDSVYDIVRFSQQEHFPDVFSFFMGESLKDAPIITQLNLFLDSNSIIRVKSKMRKLKSDTHERYPVLLCKTSPVTNSIIWDYHVQMLHAGTYKILTELNKKFYIPCAYSTVKKVIQTCIPCRKVNQRPIQINQNDYRDYRVNCERTPFREIMIDHAGPFHVQFNNTPLKAYVLVITCIFTRGVNLIVSPRIDKENFLLSLQNQIYEFGIPQRIISDEGSAITSSMSSIKSYLSTPSVQNFLKSRNIRVLEYSPYPANASFLGGMVENMVKQFKHMIYKSISKTVLPYEHFVSLVNQCKMILNKRPISCKNVISDQSPSQEFQVITPELLIHGYEKPVLSIVPQLDEELIDRYSTSPDHLVSVFDKLRIAKHNLEEKYYGDFVQNLRNLGYKKSRFKKRTVENLKVNDLVSIRQDFLKPYNYPVGLVVEVEVNDINECVSAKIRKSNGEVVCRHVTDLILLESGEPDPSESEMVPVTTPVSRRNPIRSAALTSRSKTRDIFAQS